MKKLCAINNCDETIGILKVSTENSNDKKLFSNVSNNPK